VADEQALKLEADLPADIHISGNRELIGQALGNLIDNAIKYSDGGENPLIKVSLVRRDGAVVLAVADHGPGVPANRREDVVERFVRLDESRSKPGTGLGLSLVEAVMEMHQGALELSDTVADAENNRGLTASMVFPFRAA
jgi:signal transduction histidine kinase